MLCGNFNINHLSPKQCDHAVQIHCQNCYLIETQCEIDILSSRLTLVDTIFKKRFLGLNS